MIDMAYSTKSSAIGVGETTNSEVSFTTNYTGNTQLFFVNWCPCGG